MRLPGLPINNVTGLGCHLPTVALDHERASGDDGNVDGVLIVVVHRQDVTNLWRVEDRPTEFSPSDHLRVHHHITVGASEMTGSSGTISSIGAGSLACGRCVTIIH